MTFNDWWEQSDLKYAEQEDDMKRNTVYRILCVGKGENNGCWWNNDTGWGSFETSDIFSRKERYTLNLPVDGAWVSYKRRTVGRAEQ